jgi:putative glycosyltransferase (TIGR04372 family)
MGKVSNQPVQISHPNLIDYPFITDQRDLMDIWLARHSVLFISTATGLDILPGIYKNPPSLYVNALPLTHLHSSHYSTWTPKHLLWRESGKNLTLKELLKNNYVSSKDYDEKGIHIVDLSSEEILNCTKEKISRINGTWLETAEDKILQDRFWTTLKNWEGFSNLHKWIHPQSRVGAHFLRKMGESFFD